VGHSALEPEANGSRVADSYEPIPQLGETPCARQDDRRRGRSASGQSEGGRGPITDEDAPVDPIEAALANAPAQATKPETLAAVTTAAPAIAALPRPAVKPPSTTNATAAPVPRAHPPGLAEAAKSALFGTEDTIPVTVRVSPPNAVVFKNGQRFGTGTVTVNVVRGTRTTLVAHLAGYLPRTIVVDGTYKPISDVDPL